MYSHTSHTIDTYCDYICKPKPAPNQIITRLGDWLGED